MLSDLDVILGLESVLIVRLQYIFVAFFFFNDTATTEIYTLSLHDALPIWAPTASPIAPRSGPRLARELVRDAEPPAAVRDRKSTRLNSSHVEISYAVFCLKKKKKQYKSRTSLTYYKYNVMCHHIPSLASCT